MPVRIRDRPGAEEEARLVERVVDHVERARQQAERREGRVRLEEEQAQADPEEHVTDLADDVKRHEPLDVVLPERGQRPHEETRGAGERDDDAPGPGGRRERQEAEEHPQQAVDAQLGHGAAERRGRAAGRRG